LSFYLPEPLFFGFWVISFCGGLGMIQVLRYELWPLRNIFGNQFDQIPQGLKVGAF